MLVLYGNTVVKPDWEVDEKEASGYCRVYYVHSGDVVYSDDSQSCKLKGGHVYIMPNCVPYRISRNREYDFVCTFLHIDIPMIKISGMIELKPEEDSSLYYYMNMMRKLIDEERREFLRNVSQYIVYYCRENEHCSSYSEFLYKISTYIQEHISEKITIEELSALFHYNPNYFIDVFKREANCTPYQYILRMRMQKALQLLWRKKDVQYIAEAIGYADISSFSRAFTRYYGQPPKKYVDSRKASL